MCDPGHRGPRLTHEAPRTPPDTGPGGGLVSGRSRVPSCLPQLAVRPSRRPCPPPLSPGRANYTAPTRGAAAGPRGRTESGAPLPVPCRGTLWEGVGVPLHRGKDRRDGPWECSLASSSNPLSWLTGRGCRTVPSPVAPRCSGRAAGRDRGTRGRHEVRETEPTVPEPGRSWNAEWASLLPARWFLRRK